MQLDRIINYHLQTNQSREFNSRVIYNKTQEIIKTALPDTSSSYKKNNLGFIHWTVNLCVYIFVHMYMFIEIMPSCYLSECETCDSLETVAEASPTLHSDNQGTQSGDDGTDAGQVTTKDPTQDLTQPTFPVDYTDLDTTMMEEEGTVTLHTESGWCVQF